MWKPITWFGWKSYFYNLYTVVIIILTYGFTLAEGLDLIFVSSSIDDFMNNIFSLLAMVNVCAKIAGVLGKRKDIYKISQNLQTGCTTLFEIAGAGITIGRMCADRPENELPYRTVLPYDYSKPIIYRFTVVMQFLIICISGTILAGFDTLFPGIMLQICAKINILKHRFQVIVTTLEEIRYEKQYDVIKYQQLETNLFKVWIKSHNDILRLSKEIESIFSTVIIIQFSVSAFVLCTTIYLISQVSVFTVEFAGNFLYLIAMVAQIFIFCISAHQVTLEFSDLSQAMYNTNWFVLSTSAKRSIVLMMVRTLRPIVFSSGHLATFSLDSFKSLMKVTYSTYSVLKTS
ncbi:hypothetical protein PV326_013960 [Microctonus aethiopoides]|uniref:Odorant receptor n=1 Tax=Microctonus aethiopoides TaxID=144406 RepID=A0AA39FMP6_9HYME|nr:hypothetical protein PV326_013960 [Microctonus aethiopoides]KAK0172469.1 hypothetical protein PV328_005783 [Microctonus aethiopoides]